MATVIENMPKIEKPKVKKVKAVVPEPKVEIEMVEVEIIPEPKAKKTKKIKVVEPKIEEAVEQEQEQEPVPVPVPEQKIEEVIEPKAKKTKKEKEAVVKPEKVNRPLNDYQVFINEKVAELKHLSEHKDLKYMELRALANQSWRIDHPVDETKPPRKPRVKKEKEPKPVKEEKPKRAPTAYNIFIGVALLELKAEYAANATEKPAQKELMCLAAAKWREHKASIQEE